MATRYVTLKDSNGDTIYPQSVIAQVANGEITTGLLADGAVTPAKMSSSQYSLTETQIGTWIDGSPLYRKIIDFGALPNASEKRVNHGVNGIRVKAVFCTARNPQNNLCLILPVLSSSSSNFVTIYVDGTAVDINTNSNDRSAFTECYVILEYTKA